MDDLLLTRMIGLGALVVVFVLTVILMPKIYGHNEPEETSAAPTPANRLDEAASREERLETPLKR